MTAGGAVSDGPRIDRPVTLHLRGDWGQANMHRICGWIAQEVGDRTAAGSQFAIWSGRGGRDSIEALLSGRTDIAVLTPTPAARLFHRGWGVAAGRPVPALRALGVIPQRDRLVVAVDSALPVHDLTELAADPGALRLATSPDDGINLVGWSVHRALEMAGIDLEEVRSRGGRVHYDERPFPVVEWLRTGHANAVIHEAVMMPAWQRLGRERQLRYLPMPEVVLDGFARWEWPAADVPRGYLPGLEHDLRTLDFSDFAVLCREDLPDDVAELVTWCLVHTRSALEGQYRHLDPDHSPVTYPLEPDLMARTPVPLHAAAAPVYAQAGTDQQSQVPAIWA
ncbi:TAXI family TRAP transporter solute-binding subunit [Actinomadura opuntiae]|uniref:TAXI family TRAP transporter solute-binding subunit n=1 Tax=Actinomadura sp. OS1-43 TaxID=604315 RepID=UPI00255AB0F7|nr:TAXI family TRAP transporter solute-binding subunit [Actinomadura sp. OS1-43]MDL4821799.1 hypothetical protein [Actinomadura sp. OS1-43]